MTEREAPVVELACQDGTVVGTVMHRDESMDRAEGDPRGPVTYFRAVPEAPVRRDSFEVRVVRCPPRTAFWVDVPRVGPGLSSLMDEDPS